MPLSRSRCCAVLKFAVLGLLCITAGNTVAAPPNTRPVAGLRDNTPKVHALTGARIVVAPGRIVEKGTVVVRDGVIEAVGDVNPPADARIWDLEGKTIYRKKLLRLPVTTG